MNRKDFLKKALLAIGVGAVVPRVLKGEDSTREWATDVTIVEEKLIEHPGNFFYWDLLQHKISSVRCVVVGVDTIKGFIEFKSTDPKTKGYSYWGSRDFIKENFYLVTRHVKSNSNLKGT